MLYKRDAHHRNERNAIVTSRSWRGSINLFAGKRYFALGKHSVGLLETDLTRKKSADQGVSLYLAGYLTILGYAKFLVINFRLEWPFLN